MRRTENKKLIESLPMQFNDPPAVIRLRILGNILKVLIDISKSQALIADSLQGLNKQSKVKRRSEGQNVKN